MLRNYNKIFLHIFVPIFCGTTIYVFWRGLHLIDPEEKVFPLFSVINIPDWIKYNLPDGLWFYALLTVLLYIWENNFSECFVIWLFLAIILSYISEVLQKYHFLSGTFDFKDLLAYTIASSIFYFFNFQKLNQQLLLTFKIIIK